MKTAAGSAALLALAAGAAGAQLRNYETPGNLAATQDPGCIAAAAAGPGLSPADLSLGVVTCARAEAYERALEMFLVMQLRAVWDTRRVADATAHQGAQVLAMEVHGALDEAQIAGLSAEFDAFGGNDSPRHAAFCAVQREQGPPDYHPGWMIQHGLGALGAQAGDALEPGFDAAAAWADVLTNFMKCGG